VREVERPLLVIAGAGSGKTRVITLKMAHLLGPLAYQPESVRAVTFTNKAASEMKTRVRELIDTKAASALKVTTFHRLGLELVGRHVTRLDLKPGFSILGDADTRSIMQDMVLKSAARGVDAARARQVIHDWKNDLVAPADLRRMPDAHATETPALIDLYEAYDEELRARNAVDFDDLIALPARLVEHDEELREACRAGLRYLLVDEYQDTNRAQYRLMKALVGPFTGLTVVGDDDQSIYSWRGARPENLHDLARDFPTLEVVKLEENYRSFRAILDTANALIRGNPHLFEKTLFSRRGAGQRPRVIKCVDGDDEAERIADLIAHHRFVGGRRFRDYAVLYRSNHQARAIELALRERQVPYRLVGGASFFDAPEIKDVLAWCRIIANPNDNQALYRAVSVPRRGIGTQTLRAIEALAEELACPLGDALAHPELSSRLSSRAAAALGAFNAQIESLRAPEFLADPARLLTQLIADIDYADWLERSSENPDVATRRTANVEELGRWFETLSRQGHDLPGALNQLMIFDILERRDSESDADQVTLSTLHAAKGLEFAHVYMIGMEEGILPHAKNTTGEGLEEERRLAYVGITRAMETLTLSYAGKRKMQGKWLTTEISRFLGEIPRDLLAFGDEDVDPEQSRQTAENTLASLRGLLS